MNKYKILTPLLQVLSEQENKGSIKKLCNNISKRMYEILENKEKKDKDFLNEIYLLQTKIQFLISFINSINNDNISQRTKHDLRNKSSVITAIDGFIYLKESNLSEQNIKLFEYSAKTFLYFIESLYINNISVKKADKFIKKFKINYKLKELIDFLEYNLRISKINININIDNNLIINGLKGDFYIFLENIIKNSVLRGKARNITIYTNKEGKNTYLYIADNGSGIDNKIFKNPNDILKGGNSGNGSTGIGLSNLDKRQINCEVSNNGLKSHFKNIEEIKKEIPHFKGKFNTKGTLIKIKLKTQKAE